jgi:hypothetical protein
MLERGVAGRAFDYQPLGAEVCSRVGQAHPPSQTSKRMTRGEWMKLTSSLKGSRSICTLAVDSEGNTLDLRHECPPRRALSRTIFAFYAQCFSYSGSKSNRHSFNLRGCLNPLVAKDFVRMVGEAYQRHLPAQMGCLSIATSLGYQFRDE